MKKKIVLESIKNNSMQRIHFYREKDFHPNFKKYFSIREELSPKKRFLCPASVKKRKRDA